MKPLNAWRAGLRKHWPKELPSSRSERPASRRQGPARQLRALLYFAMLASLVGELELEETDSIVTETMGSGDFTLGPDRQVL